MAPQKLFFVDFEASSLNPGSYPIEIAWVDESGQGENYLIRPEPLWVDWAPDAQKVHGISRKTLVDEGRPAKFVAKRAREVLKNAIIISDNPAFDEYWLAELYAVAGYPMVRLEHIQMMLNAQVARMLALNEAEIDSREYFWFNNQLMNAGQRLLKRTVDGAVAQMDHPHRALADATGLWTVWKIVTTAFDDRISRRVPWHDS